MRLIIALLTISLVTLVCACSGGDKDSFRNVDHDKNGKISYEELLFVFPDVRQDMFNRLDTDGDGSLSPEEYAVFLRQEAARAAEAKKAPAASDKSATGSANGNGRAVPYTGEEVIEIPAPSTDQPSRNRQEKNRKGAKDAKAQPETASRPGEPIQYTIQRGDNLSRLAHKYGISVEDIVKANGNMNPDTLRDGQVITIPPRP